MDAPPGGGGQADAANGNGSARPQGRRGMNFSQIKCFLAAADCMSFTRAAERMFISQPVLSRQIAAMEEELGMELFSREKKVIRLTPAGEVMANGLRKIAGEYRDLVDKAGAVHKGFEGSLNIGMIEGQLICPPYSVALNRFREKYPNVHVNLSRHTLASLRHALDQETIDIAFTASFEITDEEGLEYIEVGTSKTMLVVPKSHPLAGKEGVTLSDFKDDTVLTLPESESPHIASSIKLFTQRLGTPPRTLEAPNIGALGLWLEAGYGIFPLNSNHQLKNNPNLVFMDVGDLGFTTEVVMWKKDSANPMIRSFVAEFDPFEQSHTKTS